MMLTVNNSNTVRYMRIDLTDTSIVPLSSAARLLPAVRGDKPLHRNTLFRWATVGCPTDQGEPVVLETFFVGRTRMTTPEMLATFCERLSQRQPASRHSPAAKPQRQKSPKNRHQPRSEANALDK